MTVAAMTMYDVILFIGIQDDDIRYCPTPTPLARYPHDGAHSFHGVPYTLVPCATPQHLGDIALT